MPKLLFCHILDPTNLGDRVCCPLPYFQWPGFECVEIDQRAELSSFDWADAVILGGGGMLCEGFLKKIGQIWARCRKRKIPVIGWGFGINLIGETTQRWPRYLKHFDLLGIRDPASPYRYVPCPSCLWPTFALARKRAPEHDVVYYSHRDAPIAGEPGMTHTRAPFEMSAVVDFLASGREIVTSTFHGAYWGYLLNRKVTITSKWASRFYSLPERSSAGYYASCVTLNRKYYLDVLEKLR